MVYCPIAAATRVGMVDDKLVVNPSVKSVRCGSQSLAVCDGLYSVAHQFSIESDCDMHHRQDRYAWWHHPT